MQRLTGYIQRFLLAAGAALVGGVIGTLIKPPATAVTVILLAVGVAFLTAAILHGRRQRGWPGPPYGGAEDGPPRADAR